MHRWFGMLLLLGVMGCESSDHEGYEKLENGTHRKLLAFDDRQRQPAHHDILELTLAYRTLEDSVLMISHKNVQGGRLFFRFDTTETGVMHDALGSMHKGDSTAFIFDTEDLFQDFLKKTIPQSLTDEPKIRVDVHVLDVFSPAELDQKKKERQEQLLALEMEEQRMFKQYLRQEQLDSTHFVHGIYKETLREGTGPTATANDFVSIRYQGKFLNGSVFEGGDEGTELDFILSKPEIVIKGIEIALYSMSAGEKARITVPSQFAFGERGIPGLVDPYTSLIYEVELIQINDNE